MQMLHVIALPPPKPSTTPHNQTFQYLHAGKCDSTQYMEAGPGEAEGTSSQTAWLTKRGHDCKRDLDIAQQQNICLA